MLENAEGIRNTDSKKKPDGSVAKSFVWKLLERILSQGINFVIQIVLARILMPEDFASLALIVVFVNYAAIFVQAGLSTAIIQKQDLDETDVSTLLVLSLAVAAIFYVILFFAAPFIANYYNMPVLKSTLRVLGIILFFNAINSIQIALLQRNMQFKSLFIRSIIAVPVAGAIGIGMAYAGFGIWALVAYNLANIFLMVIIIVLTSHLHIKLGFSWKRARKLYSFSGKILVSSLVSGLSDSVRTAVIGHRYSSSDLAYYDKAYTYSFYIVQTIGYSISSVMLPVLSREQDDHVKLKQTARTSIGISTFFMFPLLLGIIIAAEPLIITLLTDKWAPCIPYLILFCIMRLPECMITIDKQVYYALGKSGICLIYEVILCVLNMASLFLALYYGIIYIALGAAVVGIISGIVVSVISAKIYGYKLTERLKDIYKPFINATVMAALIFFLKYLPLSPVWMLLLQILIGIIAYFFLAWITKDKNIMTFKTLLTNIKNKKETEQM